MSRATDLAPRGNQVAQVFRGLIQRARPGREVRPLANRDRTARESPLRATPRRSDIRSRCLDALRQSSRPSPAFREDCARHVTALIRGHGTFVRAPRTIGRSRLSLGDSTVENGAGRRKQNPGAGTTCEGPCPQEHGHGWPCVPDHAGQDARMHRRDGGHGPSHVGPSGRSPRHSIKTSAWIPAFAGMTSESGDDGFSPSKKHPIHPRLAENPPRD